MKIATVLVLLLIPVVVLAWAFFIVVVIGFIQMWRGLNQRRKLIEEIKKMRDEKRQEYIDRIKKNESN